MRWGSTFTLLLLVSATGCMHTQLRKHVVRQARTVGDIQTQQVLDNLAMFVHDPNSLPSFSYPNQSSSNISDTGSASLAPGWSRITTAPFHFFFSSLSSSVSGSRQAVEGFTLNPVNDPRKLELMRCAYQKAVTGVVGRQASESCPDCQSIQKKFYTGDPDGDISKVTNGIVTSDCLGSNGWFHYGCGKCLRKRCKCEMYGHYCGIHVWVDSAGQDELTKLTLAILDYAQNSAPVPLTKTVSYYIDEYGLPTTQTTSVGSVNAAVQITELPASLMSIAPADEVRLEQIIRARLVEVNLQIVELQQKIANKKATGGGGGHSGGVGGGVGGGGGGNSNDKGTPQGAGSDPDTAKFTALLTEQQSLQSKLRYLTEQLRIETLKHPYVPVGPVPQVPSSILPFQLQQQTLAPLSPTFFVPPTGG
jgi:hypothetical protein